MTNVRFKVKPIGENKQLKNFCRTGVDFLEEHLSQSISQIIGCKLFGIILPILECSRPFRKVTGGEIKGTGG